MAALFGDWQNYIWFIGIPLVFIVIVIWVMRPKEKKHWERDARIPFEESKGKQRNSSPNDDA